MLALPIIAKQNFTDSFFYQGQKKKDDKRKKHKTIEVPIQEIDKKEKHQQNDTKRVKNKQKAKKREKNKDSKKTTSTAKCIKRRTFSTIKEKR